MSLAKELFSRGYDLVICPAGEMLRDAAGAISPDADRVIAINAICQPATERKTSGIGLPNSDHLVDVACINASVGVGGIFREMLTPSYTGWS